jgi:hypothetical protein
VNDYQVARFKMCAEFYKVVEDKLRILLRIVFNNRLAEIWKQSPDFILL